MTSQLNLKKQRNDDLRTIV